MATVAREIQRKHDSGAASPGVPDDQPLSGHSSAAEVVLSYLRDQVASIARYDPLTVDSAHRLAPPSWAHWLGTDSFGRDVWARIIHGARISLAVGIGSTALGSSIGVLIGLVSGYIRWADGIIMRVMDGMMAIPAIMLSSMLAASTTSTPGMARALRKSSRALQSNGGR